MNKSVYLSIIVLFFFVFCNNDKSILDKNSVNLEGEDVFLLEMKGVVVGSSGHYTLIINRHTSFISFYFNDSLVQFSADTSFELSNSLELTNEFLTFEASLDNNGNPNSRVEIPSHNREVITTTAISVVGEESRSSTSFLPEIDPSMANYNGTIEGELSIDNGNNYSDQVLESSTYNITVNNNQITGLLKCNTCLDESIYTVNGSLSNDNDTHTTFNIHSITNRENGEEVLPQPREERYEKHGGGLLLKREEFQTIGIDSVIKKTTILRYIN